MHLSQDLPLVCPLDGGLLVQQEQSLQCNHGHSYDVAKQGYVNLLPVQHKKSKSPGDSKAMIAARSRFLATGVYNEISDKVNELVQEALLDKPQANILDAGCGEGFYLKRCLDYLSRHLPELRISSLGLDISKPAVTAAAKRDNKVSWVVGTNKSPPVLTKSLDVVLCMFGFCDLVVMEKYIKAKGLLLLVDAGSEHLLELRKILYPTVRQSRLNDDFDRFQLRDKQHLKYQISLTQEQIADLLLMTPHMYRAPKSGRDAALQLKTITLTIDVVFRLLQLD